ncbi:MAG TPA: hypothetical protein VFP60_03700 [Pseudolabrys sp.]|nr:hypothetical protein [Pseudolabrys sp.]
MADDLIPADVRDFILRYVDSVAQWEALLLLRGSPEQEWELSQIAKRLYITEKEAAEVLSLLCEDGFLTVKGGRFQYGCASAEQRNLVDRLAMIYSRHLIPVTKLIHSKPKGIRQFADAFKFRKDS